MKLNFNNLQCYHLVLPLQLILFSNKIKRMHKYNIMINKPIRLNFKICRFLEDNRPIFLDKKISVLSTLLFSCSTAIPTIGITILSDQDKNGLAIIKTFQVLHGGNTK